MKSRSVIQDYVAWTHTNPGIDSVDDAWSVSINEGVDEAVRDVYDDFAKHLERKSKAIFIKPEERALLEKEIRKAFFILYFRKFSSSQRTQDQETLTK